MAIAPNAYCENENHELYGALLQQQQPFILLRNCRLSYIHPSRHACIDSAVYVWYAGIMPKQSERQFAFVSLGVCKVVVTGDICVGVDHGTMLVRQACVYGVCCARRVVGVHGCVSAQ